VKLETDLYEGAQTAWKGYLAASELRKSITEAVGSSSDPDLAKAVTAFTAKLTAVGGAAPGGGRRGGFGGGRGGGAAPVPSFTTVDGALIRAMSRLDSGDMAPSEPELTACKGVLDELKTVDTAWKTLLAKDLPVLNAALTKAKLQPVIPPTYTL
jgi:hypothetical protein